MALTVRGKNPQVIRRQKYTTNLCLGENIYIYIYILEKKKRPTLSHQLKKINRYPINWSKEKTTVNCC